MGFWFPPDSHTDVGSYNCPLPPHLPHSQLSTCPCEGQGRGMVFERTTWGNSLGKQTQLLTIGGDLHIHGLCACQSPTAPQRSFEPILCCKPETGTEWASKRPPKQEAGTVSVATIEELTY